MWSDIEILAKMPCWYFDRKQIKNSPSFLSGIDTSTENRYRREGARFIIDAGTKMGLRWDTCATGVVYFHRFYMFHSFKEFYRYVTAACCLFLAGKVEETPKKCKDVIKIAQNLLSSASFAKFGDDPREEVMTMERILLKTIKFDFNVEHPYSHLLKYAKNFKCEKEKIQNMAQMAWTFINDSLCTTLCLQWEPEIVCISLMYLASRLTKFEPSDWSGRTSSKSKWWEDWLEGMSMELMEDICHQVLDLYSNKSKKQVTADSPPNSPVKASKIADDSTPPPPPDRPPPIKRPREDVKSETESASVSEVKEKESKYSTASKQETESNSSTATSTADDAGITVGAPIPVAQHRTPNQYRSSNNNNRAESDSYSSYNPYVSSRMFSSSFMSQEGSQNIQSILAGNSAPPPAVAQPAVYSEPPPPSHHGPPDASQYPPPTASVPPPHTSQYTYHPQQTQYAPPSIPPPHAYHPPANPPPTYDPYNPPVSNPSYHPPSSYSAPPPVSISTYLPPPTHPPTNSYGYPHTHVPPPSLQPQHPQHPPAYHQPSHPPSHQPSHAPSHHTPSHPYSLPRPTEPHQSYGGVSRNYSNMSGSNTRKEIPALTEIKITGRTTDWNMNN